MNYTAPPFRQILTYDDGEGDREVMFGLDLEGRIWRQCWDGWKVWDPYDDDCTKPPRPRIVCLCGSTRFADHLNTAAEQLTLEGHIVVRPEVVAYSAERDPQRVAPELKARLDELHLRKIDLADEVFVVNPAGYIGDSTRAEIAYATEHGKRICYLEAPE